MFDLDAHGPVDESTMREFDEGRLVPVADLAPPDIKALRLLSLVDRHGLDYIR